MSRLALTHSNKDAALLLGLNVETVKTFLRRALPQLLEGYAPPVAQHVGLDICRKWAVLVDLDTGKRLEAQKMRNPGDLVKMLKSIPWVPSVVVVDMEAEGLRAVREAWPLAQITVDRFHVEQRVRVTVERYLRDCLKGGSIKGALRTFRRSGKQCGSPEQQAVLTWRDELNVFFEDARTSEQLHMAVSGWLDRAPGAAATHQGLQQLLKLLRGLVLEISRYAAGRWTNGVVEALNKSIAAMYQNGGRLSDDAMRAKLLLRPSAIEQQAEADASQAEIDRFKAVDNLRTELTLTPLSTTGSDAHLPPKGEQPSRLRLIRRAALAPPWLLAFKCFLKVVSVKIAVAYCDARGPAP